MSGTVSTRWYFPDWLSDPGLRASSLAARGLWMDLLCVAGANKGKDHGYVIIGGRVASDADIARMVGAAVEEIKTLVAELAANGVFNRDRRQAIYCRRMVRAEKSRTNGRLGGNPNLMKNNVEKKQVRDKSNPHIPEPVPGPSESKTAAPPKPAKRATPRTRIPERAVLAEGPNMDFALSKGFSASDSVSMFEEFRDYHVGKGNQMADWAAAWRTWVRNQIKFKRGGSNAKTTGSLGGYAGVAARFRNGGSDAARAAAEVRPDEPAEGVRPLHGR